MVPYSRSRTVFSFDEAVRSQIIVSFQHGVAGYSEQVGHDSGRRQAGIVKNCAVSNGLSNVAMYLAVHRNA